MRAAISIPLLIALLFASIELRAAEPNWRVSLLNPQLAALVLPRVRFRDADLIGTLQYLRRKADEQSHGALQVSFVLDLPADFKPRYELTLDVAAVPFSEALRYVGELSGVQFSQESGVVFVRPEGSGPAPPPLPEEKKRPVVSSAPSKAVPDALAKPAEAVAVGNNLHRNMTGEVQPDKSGYIPHRSLSGFSESDATKKGMEVNCPHLATCPAGVCGCGICCCVI